MTSVVLTDPRDMLPPRYVAVFDRADLCVGPEYLRYQGAGGAEDDLLVVQERTDAEANSNYRSAFKSRLGRFIPPLLLNYSC